MKSTEQIDCENQIKTKFHGQKGENCLTFLSKAEEVRVFRSNFHEEDWLNHMEKYLAYQIIPHKSFDRSTTLGTYDIAIIKVDRPLRLLNPEQEILRPCPTLPKKAGTSVTVYKVSKGQCYCYHYAQKTSKKALCCHFKSN